MNRVTKRYLATLGLGVVACLTVIFTLAKSNRDDTARGLMIVSLPVTAALVAREKGRSLWYAYALAGWILPLLPVVFLLPYTKTRREELTGLAQPAEPVQQDSYERQSWSAEAQREAAAHVTAMEGALSRRATITAYLVASLSSAVVWFGISLSTGHNEAWDSSLYFVAGLPALAVVALVLGYAYPERPGRWAVAAGGAQVVSAFVLHPAMGPLMMIGITLFALITGGLVLAAHVGAGLSHWKHRWHTG